MTRTDTSLARPARNFRPGRDRAARGLHGGAGLRASRGPDVGDVQGGGGLEGRRSRATARRTGPWWEAFGDPDLDALVRRGERLQPDRPGGGGARARGAGGDRRSAHGSLPVDQPQRRRRCARRVPAARSRRRPRRASPTATTPRSTCRWEIDLWGRIRRGIEASETSAQAVAADLAAAQLSMQALLAQDYLLLRVQDAEIALLRDTAAGYERSLTSDAQPVRGRHRQSRRRRAGRGAARVDAGAAAGRDDPARAARARDRRPGRQAAGRARDRPEAARRRVSADAASQCPSELLERRPDIAAAERRTASANARDRRRAGRVLSCVVARRRRRRAELRDRQPVVAALAATGRSGHRSRRRSSTPDCARRRRSRPSPPTTRPSPTTATPC